MEMVKFLSVTVTILTVSYAGSQRPYSFQYLGCYRDFYPASLSELQVNLKGFATREICLTLCFNAGFEYAGLQNGYQCNCGNTGYKRYGRGKGCIMKCEGNGAQNCGGHRYNAVYRIVGRTTTVTTPTTATTTVPTTSTTTTTRAAITTAEIAAPNKIEVTTSPSNALRTPLPDVENTSLGGRMLEPTSLLGVYVGTVSAVFIIVVVTSALLCIKLKRRYSRAAKECESTKKYNNPSYMAAGSDNYGQSFTYITPDGSPPSYNENAYANVDTRLNNTYDIPAYSDITTTSYYSNADSSTAANKQTTNKTAIRNAALTPSNIYASVYRSTTTPRVDNSIDEPIYSIAEDIEDDLVIVENDLYGS